MNKLHIYDKRVADLILRFIVDCVSEVIAERNVEFEAAEGPRHEDDLARLCVKRKVLDVQCAVGLDQSLVQ